jgi:hypothetical protein
MNVLTFESIHAVLSADKLLNQHQLCFEIVPTPREISSDCGTSIRIAAELSEKAVELIQSEGVSVELHAPEN